MNDKTLWTVLRLALAGLILAHGWHRFLYGGVVPFGGWLDSQGLMFGLPIAWTITVLEMVAPALFAAGRVVLPLSLVFSAIYAVGIAMVHAQHGWFVVGPGRNGVEYSVLLIVTLLCVGLHHRGKRG
jgi:putative oxidoreductase